MVPPGKWWTNGDVSRMKVTLQPESRFNQAAKIWDMQDFNGLISGNIDRKEWNMPAYMGDPINFPFNQFWDKLAHIFHDHLNGWWRMKVMIFTRHECWVPLIMKVYHWQLKHAYLAMTHDWMTEFQNLDLSGWADSVSSKLLAVGSLFTGFHWDTIGSMIPILQGTRLQFSEVPGENRLQEVLHPAGSGRSKWIKKIKPTKTFFKKQNA